MVGKAEGRFTFDIASCVVADVETFPGRWCVGFHGPDRGGRPASWVVDGDLPRLRRTLSRFAERGRIMVTYSGDQFDVPVIRHALAGYDPYAVGRSSSPEAGCPPPHRAWPRCPASTSTSPRGCGTAAASLR